MTRTSLAWSLYVGWHSSRCMTLTGVACSQFQIQVMATGHSGCVPVKAKLCCQCPSALPTSVITQGQRLHNKATTKLDQAFRTMFILLTQEVCAVLVIDGCCSCHVPYTDSGSTELCRLSSSEQSCNEGNHQLHHNLNIFSCI